MESQAPAKGAAQHELFDMEIPEATIGSTALNCFNRFAQNRIHVHFLDNKMRLTHQPVRRSAPF
jgi:hypothetical protein